MNTTIGAGRKSVRDFAIDFTDRDTYIGGRSFPKGYFTVAILNYGKETNTKLLYAGAVCNQAMADMMRYAFRTDRFDSLTDAVFTIQHTLSKLEPFCYLDVLAEEEALRDLFSEEAKQLLAGHYALLDRHADCGDLARIHMTEEEKLQGKAGVVAEGKIFELLRSYNYFCVDIANFVTAILNLEAMKLRDLKKRDESHFAMACDEFFSDPEIREALYVLQPAHGLAGFSLSPDTRMEMIVVPNPREQDAKMFARRLHFRRIMDFLVTDFFEGLHAGHSPRQCRNCGRFFHMTSARHQIYCDGIAPNDPDGRSCRTFAAQSHRLEREKATDHPALAMHRTRLNTINKHLQRGKIDQEFADTARRIAEKCKTKACSSVQYFNDRYAADISQAGIYGATEKYLGRPPIRKED